MAMMRQSKKRDAMLSLLQSVTDHPSADGAAAIANKVGMRAGLAVVALLAVHRAHPFDQPLAAQQAHS